MAEDPMRKYGYLRNWEWWQPKPRRPRRYDEPGGWGRAQGKAAAAGYSSVEEWEAAGWPHPIDPDTGQSYEGYKIDRMERGRHPDGRKMTDQDWFNPRTQYIFDYLAGARVYSKHYDWADQMRAKYPNYPMPGINMDELLRQMFPDWYDGVEEEPAPAPAAAREIPLPTAETLERMIPAGMQRWMQQLGIEPTPRAREPGLPISQIPEEEREAQRRAIRERELGRRPEEVIGPDWDAYLREKEREPTSWRDYFKLEEPEPPIAPDVPPWRAAAELIERAKGLVGVPDVRGVLPPPEQVALEIGKILVNLPVLPVITAEAVLKRLEDAIPVAGELAEIRPATAEKIIATAMLPAEWAEVGLSQVYLQRLHIVKAGEVPEEWKGNVEAEAGYELGHLLGDLDETTRALIVRSISRIGWSPFQHQLAAAKRILDSKEYEGWARYEGELVQIEPGIPLAEGYAPVDMYDPGVITQILRREEHPLAEMLGRTIVDPLNIFYIPEVRAAPGRVWTRLTGRPTGPLSAAHETMEQYAKAGGFIDEPTKEFLKGHRLKPRWYQEAVANIVDDWFKPLSQRYAAWKARGAPRVIMSLPDKAGDLTSYMRAAAKAEDEIARSYALVYPRAGTSDPNFIQVIAKALSGGLDPAQVREMRVLVIEAENYRAMGNAKGMAEKVEALEKIAKEGLSISQRWRLIRDLFQTKASSMALGRPTPRHSADLMADDAIRVLGWMFEDMPGGIDRAVTALLLKKDPKQLVKEFPWMDSKAGLEAFRLLQHIRDDSLGSLAFATGIPSTNRQGAWTRLHDSFRRIAGTYMYPSPRRDPWQRLIGQFYRIAPRTFLSTGRYPLQNIVSNFTNIWARYGWVTPRTDASSLEFINRVMGDAGFLPPGFARSITAAGEVSTERIPTLLGRKWVYEGPTARKREPPSEEALEVARKLGRRPSPVAWAARLARKIGRYAPFGEGFIDLSKWGERNASMANYRDIVEAIKGEHGRPGRGFLPTIPEGVEPNLEMRKAIEEIIASSWNWGEIIERAAELYGVERVAKAAHYLSTERIRNLGAEALEVADDLMEALSLSPSRSAFQRRYRLLKDGIVKQTKQWVDAEPDFPEEIELPKAPLEGLSPEQAQRLMALTGTAERNRGHIINARRILIELAEKNTELPIANRYRMADLVIDKAMRDYYAAGREAGRMTDHFWQVFNDGRLWPAYRDQYVLKIHATAHENIDKEIYNSAIKLGGDPATLKEELDLFPWGGLPSDLADRKMRALQDDIINSTYQMQAFELPLAPEGVETPPLDSIKAIKEWAEEKPLAANAWLEYMSEAIREKEITEAAEVIARTPAEEIQRARRASWTEGTARRLELMEQKIVRLQAEIAGAPVEAADIEQLTERQQSLYGMAMELQGLKDTLTGLPTQREVFRFWDYKEGALRRVKDPSGRVAEFAQSQIVQEIAYKHYGLEQSVQGAEALGAMIEERLGVSNRIAALENLIWEDPEMILPETAEGLEAFIAQSEPQLAQMMQYEREPYLFESGLQAYEEAVDRLSKIRAGEAMPDSVASTIKSAKEELAQLEAQREAIRTEEILRNRVPVSVEEQVQLAQDLEALNGQYVAKGIVTRNKRGQAKLFEELEQLKERGLMERTLRGPRKADHKRGLERIPYSHYHYSLTPMGTAVTKDQPVVRIEEVPHPEAPGSRWVEPAGVPGAEGGPPITAAEQAALFGAPEEVGMPTPEVPKPQLPGLEAGELFGGGEIPMEIPPEARERPMPLEMEIEGLTPEEAEKIAMEKGAYRLPGVEPDVRAAKAREDLAKYWKWPEEYIARLSPEEAIEAEANQLRHYDQPPYSWLDRFNTKEDLVRKAIEEWGLTDDLYEAGYILEDGSLLDFSGKKEGGMPGMRSSDHREITRIIEGDWPELGGGHALGYFETRANAIRIMPPQDPETTLAPARTFIFTLMEGQDPTEAQRQILRKYVGQRPEAIYVEMYDRAGSLTAKESVEMPKVSDVDGVIDRLFEQLVVEQQGRIDRITAKLTEAQAELQAKRGEWDAERIKEKEDYITYWEKELRRGQPAIPEERVAEAVTPELPAPAEILREEGVLPAYEEPAGIPTMLTNAHREALRELGYSDSVISQMTPEQGLGLIEGRLKDFAPTVETPMGPMRDIQSPVMPPSVREGAELKRDMLLQRMDGWYKDALKEFEKELGGDPANFGPVSKWLEEELRGHFGQFKIYMDKMGEATTAWTLYNYRKMNIDTLLYRGFWWPYWQTRTGHRWLRTFIENPAKLAAWARWHDTHRKINDDLPENYRDTVHIPDMIPLVGGKYWNPYFFFDPIYAWTWSLENFMPTWRREGLVNAMVTATPISPLVGMREALQPMITEEGRRVEPITPWSRALYEKTGINIEAGAIKGLETAYGEVKPTIYSAMEKGSRMLGRPGIAERMLGGPEVMPIVPEGRYQPTYMARVLIDMWLAEEITEEEFEEAASTREGPVWDRAQEEVRKERGLTEFSSIYTGVRARKLYPSEYEIEEFRRMRGMLRTMREGPEKREYREQIYEAFPWARQWDVRYDSAETARMEATISEAWRDIENESVISDKKLADAIRSRPGDLAHEYEVKQENRKREEGRRAFWQRQGVSFVFNPRTRTYEEIEEWVQGQVLGQFYYHLPEADKFRDDEGAIDWNEYNEAVESFWLELPQEIVKWPDIERLDQEVGDALGVKVNVLDLAQEVATEEAYDEYRKANDLPEEALNYTWKKHVIDVANEYYQDELKDLEYDERNMPAFFAEFGQKTADELIPYILQEYPGRWTEEELTEALVDMRMPGIWERWNQDGDERSTAISLLWAFWGGQTGLGRRRLKEVLNSTIYNDYFVDKETRNYERITNEELEAWLKELSVPNPWEDKEGALRTLYYWTVDSTGDPLLYGEEEPEARGIDTAWEKEVTGILGYFPEWLQGVSSTDPIGKALVRQEYGPRRTEEELRTWWLAIPEEKRRQVLAEFDAIDRTKPEPEVWEIESEFFGRIKQIGAEPEASGRPPGLAAPMPGRGGPWRGEGEPPVPEEEAPSPPKPVRTIPQLAGTSESAQYAQAQDEMGAWVAAGKEGDWTPTMEKWFGKDTPAGFFWEYYWDQIPPGRIADEVRKDPIIEMLLNKAFRTVYDVKEGVYEAALETLQGWREAHPELPGDPKEWAIVRQIVKKYWELRELGEVNEARALWMFFTTLLEPYYPTTKRVTTKRRRGARVGRRGGGKGGRRRGSAMFNRWRRWANIRYYPPRG